MKKNKWEDGNVNLNVSYFVGLISANQTLKVDNNNLEIRIQNLTRELRTIKAELLEISLYTHNVHDEYYHNVDRVEYAYSNYELLSKYYNNNELLQYLLQVHEATKENKNDD